MRQHRQPCRLHQPRIETLVHQRHQLFDSAGFLAQQPQDLVLALLAVADHAAHQLARLLDRLAVGGVIDPVLALVQQREAFHVGAHIAVGRNHDAGRPAHDMIAGEQRVAFLQRIA